LGGWWNSSFGTLLILLFSYLVWEKDFLKQTGLNVNLVTVGKSIVLAGITALFAWLMMKYLATEQDIKISFSHWKNYYHDVFYILNEEIVIGSFVLFAMVGKWKFSPLFASVLLAVFFALTHFVFYKWIFLDKGNIALLTLITLFLVGFVRNSLILQTGHIGYSWALHFGWIIVMFGSNHIYADTALKVSEYDRFNLYLGSTEMLFIGIIMSGLMLFLWRKKGPIIQIR